MKAGMNEDVILGMVNSEPGTYTVTADAVISLKQAGVSDKIINAMVSHAGTKSDGGVRAASAEGPLLLHDGTPLRLRLSTNLSSADATTGQTITFELLDEVTVDNLIVIARGAMATGTVTDAEPKKRMARGGKLDVSIEYVRLVDDEKVALRAVKETKGGGHTGAMTGGIVATAFIVWPAAPFFSLYARQRRPDSERYRDHRLHER